MGRQGDYSEAIKESREAEKWLGRITGTARNSKPGPVTSPFKADSAALGTVPPESLLNEAPFKKTEYALRKAL